MDVPEAGPMLLRDVKTHARKTDPARTLRRLLRVRRLLQALQAGGDDVAGGVHASRNRDVVEHSTRRK